MKHQGKPVAWTKADERELARLVRKYGRQAVVASAASVVIPGQRVAEKAFRTAYVIDRIRELNRKARLPDTIKQAEHMLYEIYSFLYAKAGRKLPQSDKAITAFRKSIKKLRLRGRQHLKDQRPQ
jgi:RNase P/RNase MRP subunit p30